uniref:EGF-like domain-containing protein n=1 Tax=Loa loa TaxID=7209 RepID=A0A1I7VSX8_LOALO
MVMMNPQAVGDDLVINRKVLKVESDIMIGRFKCVEKCDSGYRLVNETCVDINECIEKTFECNNRASCVNIAGGYQCICEDGFTGDGQNCTPLNDCSQQEGICDRHAFCIGTLRMCVCQSGYIGDGLNCYDVNECAARNNPCEGQIGELRCVNIDGGYICCEQDLDDIKCIREKGAFCSGGCGLHAICYNETCQCMEGFSGDPQVKCSDINECEDDKRCPGVGEWCVNLFGGFVCCNIDSKNPECLHSNSKVNGIRRTFSTGSIQQKTAGGFVVIGRQVTSSEQFGIACYFGCPADSHCVNDSCRCNDGFIGNTFEGCVDVNECELGLCNQSDSWCVNLRGSFACCTIDSTLSDCIGLEIIHENNLATGNTRGEHPTLSSAMEKILGGMGVDTSGSGSATDADDTGSPNESWSISSSRGELSDSGKRNSWDIETVGEWKNFMGHAVIIGRGRIESRKWNVTRDRNGTLIGIEVHGNRTEEEKYFASSIKEESDEAGEEGKETEGSGEGIETSDILGVGRTIQDGTLISLHSGARSSEKGSDGILAISTASALLTVSNSGEVHKIREETKKPEVIIFRSSKAPINHTLIESRTSIEGSSKSLAPLYSTLKSPKNLATKALRTLSSEMNSSQDSSGKFTTSKVPETTYNMDAEPEAGSMKSVKLETTMILEIGKTETTIMATESNLTKSKESIDTKTNVETKTARATDKKASLTTPSNMEEQLRTTAYITSKGFEMQMHLTNKEINDSSTVQNEVIITEAITSPSIPESKSQWKKEEEQKLQPKNIATTISGADVVISVKQETITPTIIKITPKETITVIPESDSSASTTIAHSKSERPAKHGTSSPPEERSHKTTLKFGLEIAKAALTTDRQTEIEVLKVSGEHVSESNETAEVNAILYNPYSKSTKSVQLIENTTKFESNSLSVPQKIGSNKLQFIQKSVSTETMQTKAGTITLEKSSEEPTEIVESTEVPSISEQASENSETDSMISRNIEIVASSVSSLSSFNQLSTAGPNAVSVPFTKPVSQDKSPVIVAMQYTVTLTNVTPTESGIDILEESSTPGPIRLGNSLTSQATTANLSVKLTSEDAVDEVIAMRNEKIEPISGDSETVVLTTKNGKVPTTNDVELEGSGEEMIELQTVSSTNGFVSDTAIETNDHLKTIAIDQKIHEIGVEIVLVNGYPETTESISDETSMPVQRNWNNISTSPNINLNTSLTFVTTHKLESKNIKSASNFLGGKSTTAESSTFDSHGTEESTDSGSSPIDFEKTESVVDINTIQNMEATPETTASEKQDSFEERGVVTNEEIRPTTSIYRSENASSSTSGITEIAMISKPSASESTKEKSSEMFLTTSETLTPIGMGTRLRNTLELVGSDKTTVLHVDDGKLGAVTTPQSKQSSVAFLTFTTKEILVKASKTSEEPTSSTAENTTKVKTITEGAEKGVMTTDEGIKYFAYSTAKDLNISSRSATVTEADTWKPNTKNITEPMISTISEATSGGIHSDIIRYGSPFFRIAEIPGTTDLTEADLSQRSTLSKSNLEIVSTIGSTKVFKTERETAGWTLKPEEVEKSDIILKMKTTVPNLISGISESTIYPSGTSIEVEQTSMKGSVSDENLFRITQQETVNPLYANISKSNEYVTATKETYTLQEITETAITQNDTPVLSLRCRSNDECGTDAYCERRSGVCRCYPGFDGQPPMTSCVDIDECERHLDDCHLTARCSNIVGGFMCFCETGYRMSKEHICADIDECQERAGRPCSQHATCINMPGSYRCQCNLDYTGDGYTCIPIDKRHCREEELAKSNCGRNQLCLVDDKGEIDCDTCKKGFVKEGTDCVDINECAQNGVCHENAFCENIDGSYSCHCQSGYKGDGNKCDDIDECQNNPCHPQGICINYPGSFNCKCPDEWVGDGKNECINPSDTACLDKLSVCNQVNHTSCLSVNLGNMTRSICECVANYRYNHDKRICEDIDECVENRHSCDPSNSICVNTVGGYICVCAPGYEGVGGVCVDVNECERGIAGCNLLARCENHLGSVGCKCPPGFISNGVHCIAVKSFTKTNSDCNDEWKRTCRDVNRTCHIDDEDVQQCGSCIIGYQPLNGRCLPVQEAGNCANPQKNDCDANAECIDVHPGRHFCTCKVGYIGDGRHCDGPNCHLNVSMCHKNARCQLDGNCKCNSGYHGDGVDVCQLESGKEQAERMFENKTDISTVIKADKVNQETKEKSVTLTYDSVSASGFGTSFTVMPITEITQTAKDVRSQQSSAVGAMTRKDTSITEENSEKGSIIAVTTSRTLPGWISETSHVMISEGSGEDDAINRDWQLSTKTDNKLFTATALPSEMASVRDGVKGTTGVFGFDAWVHSGPISLPKGAIIPERIQKAGIHKCTVANHSACHELAICAEQSGECVCKLGYHGDGYSICMKDTEDCTYDPTVCDLRAVCDELTHTCKCIQGYIGDGVICAPDTFDCLLRPNLCSSFAECIGRRCICSAGYTGDGTECVKVEPLQDCTRCDIKAKCYNTTCICDKGYFGNGAICIADPEDCIHYPGLCHSNAICDQEKRRCKCTRGYVGNGIECNKRNDSLCLNDRSICDQNAECLSTGICQCKQGFEGDGYYCCTEKVTQTTGSNCKQQCVANEECYRGECRCVEGYKRGPNATCMDIDECSMGTHDCHPMALCTNVPGSFICICPIGYRGNGRKCSQHHLLYNMSVDCELDRMTLFLINDPDLYDSRIFVRGQNDNPFCSKKLDALLTNETEYHLIIQYSHCNVRVEGPNTIAVTVVIQRHPMFITEQADAYDIRCTYPVGVRKVASHVGISEITTTKTIIETGVGPTCSLTVTNEQDQPIDTATVGQPLKLALTVYPNDTYAVLPRNCFAINLETGELYLLTDQCGCAIDTELFPEWTYRQVWLTTARFRTFKWPDSSMIRFQCDCSACIESCPKVNCTERHESMKQHRFRHIREIPRNSVDEELEKHLVKGAKWMAYSRTLHVNEEEELVRAQRDMKRWKYQDMKSFEEPIDALSDGICIRALWIILSLLPLVLLLVLIGLLSAMWRKTSSAKIRWRRAAINDSASSYLEF